ncbi:hypothetical protein V8E54_005791 [Elaphomyces granulatus]
MIEKHLENHEPAATRRFNERKSRRQHLKALKKDIADSKKAHRAARRALGEKVKFVTLKLPSFTDDDWRDGIPGDEFEAQGDFIPLEDGLPQPGSSWQQQLSDEEEEFDFVLDPQGDPDFVDTEVPRWNIEWPVLGEELDPYERDSDDSMDEEPELPVMAVVWCNLVVCNIKHMMVEPHILVELLGQDYYKIGMHLSDVMGGVAGYE